MKKLFFTLAVGMLMACMNQTTHAQLYGKWVVTSTLDKAYVLTFTNNGIVDPPDELDAPPEYAEYCEFSGGGYTDSYDLEFYKIGHRLGYSDQYVQWNSRELHPEFQVIDKPGSNDHYLTIFSQRHLRMEQSDHFSYDEIYFENGQPVISDEIAIMSGIVEHKYVAFAIGDEINEYGHRLIYMASPSNNVVNDGIKTWTITENGIDPQNYSLILETSDFPSLLQDEDFSAYNMEFKRDNSNENVLVWISSEDVSYNKIFIFWPDLFDLEVIDLTTHGYGRITGIEFSSTNDNIIYASCLNEGIVKIDYSIGEPIETLISGNYQHTFLQTAPDGHIYGVSDDGTKFGRINSQTGNFEDNIFEFPNQYEELSTYRTFDNVRYYILPENQRTFNYMTLTVETTDVCPGGNEGTATVFVSGGFPPYTYQLYYDDNGTWESLGNAVVTEDTEHTFTDLWEDSYKCIVTDSEDNPMEITFDIKVDEGLFDVDGPNLELITSYEPAYWTEVNRSYEVGFRIASGVDVTITNSYLEFGKYARIIIEPGATLTLDNSTLDYFAYCGDKWRGVEVAGNKNQPQMDEYGNYLQGRLVMENNSVISNAENAVSLYVCTYSDEQERNIVWSSSGGVVQAKNSDFLNNTKSIHFIPYQNTHPITGEPRDNMSYFKLCNFELNAAYIDYSIFSKHVDLHGVNGIDFKGCSFSNTAIDGVDTWNMGIAAYGSGFNVESACNTIGDPCPAGHWINSSFEGFRRGIANFSETHYIGVMNVSEAEFSNNVKGIMNIDVDFSTIIDCDFEIGHTSLGDGICEEPEGFGIDMVESIGFAIENDTFSKYAPVPTGEYAGIRVLSCPSPHDIIYKNVFDGLSFGNYAEGQNRQYKNDDKTGVEYRCNLNSNNSIDFIVEDWKISPEEIEAGMIRDFQGNYDTASGNTFSQYNNQMHFVNNGTQHVTLRYFDNEPLQVPDPLKITNYVQRTVEPENLCPTHYGSGSQLIELSDSDRQEKESIYSQNLNDYNAVLSLYESLKDGGDTEAELTDIQTAQPEDMWNLRAQLLGDSPHLSQEVLMETSDRTDVFPDDALFDILSANPDELKEDTLISYLENKEDPLPEYMIDILEQLAYTNTTYKTILINEMAKYYAKKTTAAQDIIRSILNDSVVDYADYRNWLDNLGGLEADKLIVESYLSEGDTSNAFSLLNMIPDLYELSGTELNEYNDYKDMIILTETWKNQGKNIFELDSTDLSILENYAIYGSGSANAISKSMLAYAYNQNYCNCINTNDSTYYKSSKQIDWSKFSENFGPSILVTPNPASTWVAFDYHLDNEESVAYIFLSDISGKTVKQFKVSGIQGQQIWDTRNVIAGTYFYRFIVNGYSKSGKIIIK